MYSIYEFSLHVMQIKLENTEETIKNEQWRETGNIGYTRRRQTNQKQNRIYIGHHYT
jgi:hypothetical protein